MGIIYNTMLSSFVSSVLFSRQSFPIGIHMSTTWGLHLTEPLGTKSRNAVRYEMNEFTSSDCLR